MPRGEPTKVVRIPTWLHEELGAEAARKGASIPELIVRKLATPKPPRFGAVANRCVCAKPTLSAHAPICTTCRRPR